ncbi:Hypothetical predicted protein [Pelobates cultripes]|uniref:Uncharacterized protein n=1 Tax=Pelobates cultripes TaxID=61616 RepID=A0AAD1S311_PELCU|nr:Hypothetical predicted protein [Pelobates cultripes]
MGQTETQSMPHVKHSTLSRHSPAPDGKHHRDRADHPTKQAFTTTSREPDTQPETCLCCSRYQGLSGPAPGAQKGSDEHKQKTAARQACPAIADPPHHTFDQMNCSLHIN